MSDTRDKPIYRPLGLSIGLHILLAIAMTISWYWHTEQKTMAAPAMMKASLVYAPKSTMAPQQKTQTQKTEKPKPDPEPPKPEPEPVKPAPPKPEPPKPEPPKPVVEKPQEVKPQVKPVDKPSPIAAKPDQPKPPEQKKQPEKKVTPPKADPKKQPDKKVEPPKPDAKQADKKQDARSAIDKEKAKKDAEMAIQALLNDEAVTRTGELSDDELGKWIGLISSRIEDNWSRPPNARLGMKALLEIELASNGQVLKVTVIESSGNVAFDLSAENAVRKVERFDEISQMKPEVFNKNFRKFRLLFNPDDLEE